MDIAPPHLASRIAAAIRSRNGNRVVAAVAAGLVQALLLYTLIFGLTVDIPRQVSDTLALFTIGPKPPPPPIVRPPPAKVRSPKPEGASAPPNLRAKATEVVAPPVIPLIIPPPPPVVVATRPDEGNASHSGNADIRGPGTGAGGEGNGTGSGRYGDGDGGGGTAPRQIRGRLKDSDYARSAVEAGVGGTVGVRFMVETDGRVSDCEVDHSSGNIALDNTTCRLIQERFRFDPARDEEGRPVPSTIIENHSWIFDREDARQRR